RRPQARRAAAWAEHVPCPRDLRRRQRVDYRADFQRRYHHTKTVSTLWHPPCSGDRYNDRRTALHFAGLPPGGAMKQVVLVGALVGALAGSASAQKSTSAGNAGNTLGTITLNKKVLADGKPLAPGTYQVRLTSDSPKPATGQAPDSEKYVEFVRGGKTVGREVATVVSAEDISKIAKGAKPKPGTSKFEMLKGGEFWR